MLGLRRVLLASAMVPALLLNGVPSWAAVKKCDGPNGACRVCQTPNGPCGPYAAPGNQPAKPTARQPGTAQPQQPSKPQAQQKQPKPQAQQSQQKPAQQAEQPQKQPPAQQPNASQAQQQRQQLLEQRKQQAEQKRQQMLQQKQQADQQKQQQRQQAEQQKQQQKLQRQQQQLEAQQKRLQLLEQQKQQAEQKRQQMLLQKQQAEQLKQQQKLQRQQQQLQAQQKRQEEEQRRLQAIQQRQLQPGQPGFRQPMPAAGFVVPPPGGPMPPPQGRGPGGVGAATAIGIGVGVGAAVGGAYILSNSGRSEVEVRTHRQTVVEGGVTYVREPGRVIVREPGAPVFIRHDENERFAILGYKPVIERDGALVRTYYDRPDGVRIITVTDGDGRLLRRIRRYRDGREVVIIDNSFRPAPRRIVEQVVVMPPPVLTIPRERYIVDAHGADESTIYETLTAPPVAPVTKRYTLDEVRYSPNLRAQMRSVDVDTITFDSGSWDLDSNQIDRLSTIAAAINKAVATNPDEVFLIEGHTDAVGDPDDNLSLSDRRAQAVAEVLTKDFAVPAENLTTQGYGETSLKVPTDGSARANRRVTVRRITPLIAEGKAASGQ